MRPAGRMLCTPEKKLQDTIAVNIGVGAQSTLGGHQNSQISHDFCPTNAQILRNNCPKNILFRILGGTCPHPPPPPFPTAMGVKSINRYFSYRQKRLVKIVRNHVIAKSLYCKQNDALLWSQNYAVIMWAIEIRELKIIEPGF